MYVYLLIIFREIQNFHENRNFAQQQIQNSRVTFALLPPDHVSQIRSNFFTFFLSHKKHYYFSQQRQKNPFPFEMCQITQVFVVGEQN